MTRRGGAFPRRVRRRGAAWLGLASCLSVSCGSSPEPKHPAPSASPSATPGNAKPPDANEERPQREGAAGDSAVAMRDPTSPDPTGAPLMTVRVERDQVFLGERSVDVPALASAKLIGPLRDAAMPLAVNARREHTLPYYEFQLTDDAPAVVFKSTLQTLAFAGWPDSRVQVGDQRIELRALLPPIPASSATPDPPPPLTWPDAPLVVMIEATRTTAYRGGVELPSREPDSTTTVQRPPQPIHVGHVPAIASSEQLDALFAEACSTAPCSPAMVFVDDALKFGAARQVLGALARSATRGQQALFVELRVKNPSHQEFPIVTSRRMGVGPLVVSGRLEPAEIQKVVRGSFDELRSCYEEGLKSDPKLEGRIQVRFVIGRDGSVISIEPFDEAFPDRAVVECVLSVYRKLRFPRPRGGIVTVVYPIMFSPG